MRNQQSSGNHHEQRSPKKVVHFRRIFGVCRQNRKHRIHQPSANLRAPIQKFRCLHTNKDKRFFESFHRNGTDGLIFVSTDSDSDIVLIL